MYKKILVPLDGSKLAECVLPHVEALATSCGTGEVTLISVADRVFKATPVPILMIKAPGASGGA